MKLQENKLLDTIMEEYKLKNDAAVARFLDIPPPVISKIRNRVNALTGDRLLRIYDKTGWPIERIRELAQ